MKTVEYHKKALKDLDFMPRNDRDRVREKVKQYAENPSSLANQIVRMQGKNEIGYRLRVGDWRVRFDEDDAVVEVFRVQSRGQVYKKRG